MVKKAPGRLGSPGGPGQGRQIGVGRDRGFEVDIDIGRQRVHEG
jgi:hypothetical protein